MKKKTTAITFLIPTYKGQELLQKNLPSILAEMKTGDELLVSEDAADDLENLRFFRKKYNVQLISDKNKHGQLYRARVTYRGKHITISFFQRRVNGRFARNVNDAVNLIEHNYFFLLNNDVRLTPGCRDKLLSVLQNDAKVFAVTAQEIDINNHNEPSGRNQIWWDKGRFWHSKDQRLDQSGATAWACGGSSMYDIDKWQILGGFDTRYYPAYWEDIDISWQAHQKGWKVLYCHEAVVQHVHETTNKEVFGRRQMEKMSWRNGTQFAWKNARGRQKWEFIFFYWYWQLKQYPELKLWLAVLVLALAMRLAYLGIPHGLTVDEAAIAYNGTAIMSQRRDEWLNFLPITFRSFGDYKAPWAIYISGIVTSLLGLEIWTVRLPFALAGFVSIFVTMKLIDLLLQSRTPRHQVFAAIGGLVMTLMPWHWHFSHLGFENNWALVFQLTGVYLLIKHLGETTDKRGLPWTQKWWSPGLTGAAICLILAMYSYHSAKLTVPAILLVTLILAGRRLWQRRRLLVIPFIISLVMMTPMLQDSFCEVATERPFTFLAWSQSIDGKPTWRGGFCGDGRLTGHGLGMTRGGSSFLTNPDLTSGEKWDKFISNLSVYFTPEFLWGGLMDQATIYDGQMATNVRHGTGTSGVLLDVQLLIFMILAATIICRPTWAKKWWREICLGILMVIIGLIPAAITETIPHSNQALAAVPGFVWLTVLGFVAWRAWWSRKAIYYPSFVMLILVFAGIEFGVIQKKYLEIMKPETQIAANSAETKKIAARDQQLQKATSYLYAVNLWDAFALAHEHKTEVEQIIYAGDLEQPYIYALLAEQLTPEQYRYGKLSEKYMFVGKISDSEFKKSNIIVIYSPLTLDDSLVPLAAERCREVVNFYFGQYNNLRVCWTKPTALVTDPLEPATVE